MVLWRVGKLGELGILGLVVWQHGNSRLSKILRTSTAGINLSPCKITTIYCIVKKKEKWSLTASIQA